MKNRLFLWVLIGLCTLGTASAVNQSNLLVWYDFNNGTGTTVTNALLPGTNDLTITNMNWNSVTKLSNFSYSLYNNTGGHTGYARVINTSFWGGITNFTIIWIGNASSLSDSMLWSKAGGGGSLDHYLRRRANGTVEAFFTNTTGSKTIQETGTSGLPLNAFQCMIVQRSGRDIWIMRNNTVLVNTTFDGVLNNAGAFNLHINNYDTGALPLVGNVQQFIFYNRTITYSERETICQSPAPLYNSLDNFSITAIDKYNGTSITVFNVSITYNGTTTNYSSSGGGVTTPINKTLGNSANITITANNYFSNTTINVNTSSNYIGNITPYTAIRASSYAGGSPGGILNFTVNYTGYTNTSDVGSVSTTTGLAYVPLYNGSYDVRIYNAYNGSTTYATTNATVTASPYLHSYNFTLYLSNTINFVFIDETNLTRISWTTVTAYITGSLASYNFTTTNGTGNVSLIQPDTYTITYLANSYNQRQYIYTLTNQSTTTLTLYLRPSASSTTVLIQVNDQDLTRVQDATVNVYTKNLTGINEYLVESCLTNINGQCTISADVSTSTSLSNTTYNFVVVYNNNTVGSSGYTKISNTANSACNSALPCVQLIANIASSPLNNFFAIQSLETGNISYNGVDTFYFNFSDTGGNVQQICLYTDMRTGAIKTRTNGTCVSSSTGALVLSSDTTLGDETITSAYVYVAGNPILIDTYNVPNNSAGGAGNVLFFLVLGLGLLSTIFFAYNEQTTLALVMVGGMLNILFLISAFPTLVKGLIIIFELFLGFLIVRLKE